MYSICIPLVYNVPVSHDGAWLAELDRSTRHERMDGWEGCVWTLAHCTGTGRETDASEGTEPRNQYLLFNRIITLSHRAGVIRRWRKLGLVCSWAV